MPPALYLHQNQFSRSRRRESVDGRRSLSWPTEQERHMKPSTDEYSLDTEASGAGLKRCQPSEPTATSQGISDIRPEFLESLKRRSMPHTPQRTSSLTFPPETLQDDIPPSSPVEAAPSRSRGWREWWKRLLTGRRPSPAPTPNHDIPTNGGNDAMSTDDKNDDIPMDDGGSSDISESLDGTTIPIAEPPSARYVTPLSSLWILRRRPVWRPAAHPLVYGFRFPREQIDARDSPLDIGCQVLGGPSMFGSRLAVPPQDSDEVEEEANMDNGDADAVPEHCEDAGPSTDPDEWQGIPVIEGIDPTISNDESGLEPVGNPPPTPRPAHRNLPSASNTLLGSVRRLNETISRLRSQEFTDVALLLDLRIERRFGSSANAAPSTSMSSPNEIGGKESETSTDGTIDVVAIVGEGNLTIPEALDSSVQHTLATTVQHLADNLAQEQSVSSDEVIISIEAVGKGASSSEAGETRKSATEPEDADVGSNEEDFAPLERVRSCRPSPPLV